MTARIESAVRRPAICESSYSVEDLVLDVRGHSGLLQLRLGFAVRDEGRPGGEVGVGLGLHRLRHVGVGLDAGEERGREGGDEDRAGQRGADRGAELAGGVLQAADLGALLGRHRRDGHVAQLRRQGADAEADDEHRDEDDGGVGAHLEAGDQHQDAGDQRQHADARRRGADWPSGRACGMPTAATSSDSESGSSRTPVAIGDSPSTTERNSGTMKNSPAWIRNWNRKVMSPPVSCRDAQQRRRDERLLAAVLEAVLPAEEQPQQEEPADDEPDRQREAEQRRRALLGQQPAPRGRLEHAEDDQREAGRRDDGADEVEVRPLADRLVGGAPRQEQDGDDDDDLAGEDVAPREVRGHEAADDRADGDGDRAGGGDQPVGLGAGRRAGSCRPRARRWPA